MVLISVFEIRRRSSSCASSFTRLRDSRIFVATGIIPTLYQLAEILVAKDEKIIACMSASKTFNMAGLRSAIDTALESSLRAC